MGSSAAAAPSIETLPPPLGPQEADHVRGLMVATVDLGADLARILVKEAVDDPLPGPYTKKVPVPHQTERTAIGFERVTRAVRRGADLACTIGAAGSSLPVDDVVRLRTILIEMIELGDTLLRIVVGQATAPPRKHDFWGDKVLVPHPTDHLARCFDLVTLSMRHGAQLAHTLGQPRPSRTGAKPRLVVDNQPVPNPGGRPTRDTPDRPDWRDPPEDFGHDQARPAGQVVDEIVAEIERCATEAGYDVVELVELLPPAPPAPTSPPAPPLDSAPDGPPLPASLLPAPTPPAPPPPAPHPTPRERRRTVGFGLEPRPPEAPPDAPPDTG